MREGHADFSAARVLNENYRFQLMASLQGRCLNFYSKLETYGSFSFVKVPRFLRVSRRQVVAEIRRNPLRKP